MEHVAKWSVVAIAALGMITAVTEGLKHHDGSDESVGKVLVGVILYLWVMLATIIWWQP